MRMLTLGEECCPIFECAFLCVILGGGVFQFCNESIFYIFRSFNSKNTKEHVEIVRCTVLNVTFQQTRPPDEALAVRPASKSFLPSAGPEGLRHIFRARSFASPLCNTEKMFFLSRLQTKLVHKPYLKICMREGNRIGHCPLGSAFWKKTYFGFSGSFWTKKMTKSLPASVHTCTLFF